MKKHLKKLTLSRETLQMLGGKPLQQANGGSTEWCETRQICISMIYICETDLCEVE
jgi:hypothetical protein